MMIFLAGGLKFERDKLTNFVGLRWAEKQVSQLARSVDRNRIEFSSVCQFDDRADRHVGQSADL